MMRVRTGLGALLFAASLTAVPGFVVAASAAAPSTADPCAAAAQQLRSGKLTLRQAEGLGASLPATQGCAPERAAIGELSAAQQLFAAGLTAQADAEIVRALDTIPLLKLPRGLVPAAGQPVVGQPAADQPVAGQPATGKPVTSQPAAPSVPGGPWHAMRQAWDLLGIPISVSAALALLLLIAPWLYRRLRNRLHIQPFTLGDAAMTDIDPAAFRKQVLDELKRIADERARTDEDRALRLDIAGPYESKLDIHSVTDGLGPLGPVLGRFLDRLLNRIPGRCRLLTGTLLTKTSVRLEIATVAGEVEPAGREVISHDELRVPDPSTARDPVAARLAQLATAAAAWIILARYQGYNLGGTRKWRSFAQFVAGCLWQDDGDLAKAKEMYAAAYATDSNNIAAAHNLATLLLLAANDPESVRTGRKLLQSVLAATEGKTDNPQWYRSRYLYPLVTLDAYRYAGDLAADPDEVARASETVLELAITVEEKSLEREARAPGDQGRFGEVPTELIKSSHGAVLALTASYLVPTTTDPAQVSSDPSVRQAGAADTALRQAGAPDMAFSLLDQAKAGAAAGRGEDTDTVLGLLRQAKAGTPVLGTPEKLAAFAAVRGEPTPQLQYNLYHFQRQRLHLCDQAIADIRAAMAAGTIERTDRLERQLRELGQMRDDAEAEMTDHRGAVESSGDPLLLAAVERDTPDVPYEAAHGPAVYGASGTGWPDTGGGESASPASAGPWVTSPDRR